MLLWNYDYNRWKLGLTQLKKNNLKQDCIQVGCVPSTVVAMSIPACTGQGCVYPSMHWAGGGVCIPTCSGQGVSARGWCLPGGGVCAGGCITACTPPLWTEWLTDRCKNITFPQLRLQTAKTWGASTFRLGVYCAPKTLLYLLTTLSIIIANQFNTS